MHHFHARPGTPLNRRWVPLASAAVGSLLISTIAATGGASAAPTPPAPNVTLSNGWHSYVLGDGRAIQTAVKISSASGPVTNARALAGGTGAATLTTVDPAKPATVILDWGVEHGGKFTITTNSVAPGDGSTAVSMKVSTSETKFGLYRATTLATQADEGDTTIKVTSTDGLQVGQTVYIGDTTTRVTAVGTAGATGTGIDIDKALTGPLYPGTPVSARSADQIVGDSGGFGITSTQTLSLAQAGPTAYSNVFGGFRYQAIQLTTPGTVTISANELANSGYAADAGDYAGHFLSSDDTLNRAWYSGAYTNAMTMAKASLTGKSVDVMFDGAKRDRGVWSGDIVVQGPVAHEAFGSDTNNYYKGSLEDLFAGQAASGKLPGTTWLPFLAFYSDSYSDYTAIAAMEYYRYTGEKDFATTLKDKIEAAIAYQATKVNARGLVEVTSDPDYWQTALAGEVAEYNTVYYQLLQNAIWFETQLGDKGKAAQYTADAAALKAAMQQHLWNDDLGAYPLSTDTETDAKTVATDANAHAIQLGLVPEGKIAALLNTLRGAETPHGIQLSQIAGGVSRADGYGHEIEPLTNYWTAQARLSAGDEKGALELARTYWGQQVDPQGPYYTGTTWEFLDKNGVVLRPADSMSHGWGAGISSLLTEDVLGVTPVNAGYSTWRIAPQPGDVTWAQGSVPVPSGKSIDVSWKKTPATFAMDVSVPNATTGDVIVPLPGSDSRVQVNGKIIWANGRFSATSGISGAVVAQDHLVVTVQRGGAYRFNAGPATPSTMPGQQRAAARAVLRLKRAVIRRGRHGIAIASVEAPGTTNPGGTFQIKERGKVLARASLAGGLERLIKLPKLKVGRHRLVLVFTGSSKATDDTSRAVILTVKR